MAKYDLERLLADIETAMKASINTKIGAINTEKNDTITLKTVNSSAYVLQSLDSSVMAYDPFILYAVIDAESEGLGAATSNEYTISVILILSDTGQDQNITKRLLRYQRALQEVFQENFSNNQGGIKLKIQSMVPVELEQINSTQRSRAIGISLIANLA